MPDQPAASPQFLRDGEGDVLQFSPSERLIWKVTADSTAGAFDQFELTADPDHEGAPEHVHDAVDEAFFVLDGAFQFKLGDDVLLAEAGTFVFVPRGITHTWRNAVLRRSRMILTYMPGGMKAFFEEASPLMHQASPDPAVLEAVNERHDTRVVGPPLPAPAPRSSSGSKPDAPATSSFFRKSYPQTLGGMRRIIAQRPPAALTAALAAIILSACGAGSQRLPPAGLSRPSAAAPIATASRGWPALLHGPSHYGASTSVGPASSRVRWRRDLGGPIVAGPIITSAGTAYVGADNGVLHAVDVASGRDRWTFDGGGSYGSDLSTAAVVLASGEILWPGPRHRLFALTATGRALWTLPGGADLLTPVLDSPAGLLVVADQAGQISGYRLGSGTAAPRRLWSRTLASMSYGNPVVAADGTIYQTAGDALFALTPSGHTRWTVTTPATVEVSPAVGVNGIVVFGANDRYEYGVNPDGHLRWKQKIGNFTYSSPLTLPGRRVLYGNHSGQMTILDSDTGQVISRDPGQGQLWTAAAVDARGSVYFASRTGHIYGFDRAGHRLFDVAAGGHFDSYPALAPDGTLLIGDDDGTLFALR